MDARAWPTLAGLVTVLVAAAVVLVASGVAPGDVATWLAVLAAGVLGPGLVVTRAVRGRGPLAEDLAWSLPVGFLLALLTWGVGLALGVPVAPFWTGVAALALLLAAPVRRRVFRSRPDGDPDEAGWGLGSGSVVVASLVAAAAWAGGSALASLPIDPDRPFAWAPDTMFHARSPGELARTASPVYPMVPEGTYPYHWFFHALAAHLGQGVRAPGRRHAPAAAHPAARRRRDGCGGGAGRGPAPVGGGGGRSGRRPGRDDGAERVGRPQRHHRPRRHRRRRDGPDPALLAALGEHHPRLARGARDRGGLRPAAARRCCRAAR